MRRVVAALMTAFAVTPAARADRGPPMRAIVRMADARDGERLARIEGQTVDLNVELVPVDTGPLEPTLGEQLATARQLAESRDARAVIWFRDEPDALVAYVADPRQDTLFVRNIEAPAADGAIARSAAAEAAALIARSALRALEAGGRIGVQAPKLEPAPGPEPEPEPRPLAPEVVPWHAGLGIVGAIDGASPVQPGVAAWLGRASERWRADLELAASPPSQLDDDATRVSLTRYAVGVSTGYRLRPSWTAELRAGVLDYYRSTAALDATVSPTPPRHLLAAYVGPGLRWQGCGWLRLELALGLDAVVGAPELGYDTGGAFESRTKLWILQPRASLGVVVRAF